MGVAGGARGPSLFFVLLGGGGGDGGEDKLRDAAVAFECVPEKSLLCVLHRLISLCAKQHHTLFSSLSLHFLTDT